MKRSNQAGIEGAACRPNFSAAGRRRRRRVALGLTLLAGGTFVTLLVAHAPGWSRLVVALPAAAAAIVGLQVTRNTCLAQATAGTVEHEDFSTSKVEADFAAASRHVARTIVRDGALIGVAAGGLGLMSGWVL
ncbi:MAG: hypothetical protein INH41_25605 [Myxococcaceae bacterium]|jgi:hypothetical protein|nr:hypothetical protein [Myxococcaceae bacterium]MCA3015777.1 hypothetical protein [Myxococcaceae bacterium]